MALMDTVLDIERLSVQCGDKPILDGIDLELVSGEVFALMGPGGAGKSTLLNILGRPSDDMAGFQVDGGILYEAGPLSEERRPALIGQTLGLVSSTVFEFLASNDPKRSDKTRRQLEDRYVRLLERFGLSDLCERLDREVVVLDRFEHVLLALMRAILRKPSVICIDEPMAGTGESGAARILALLERMRDSGSTVLLVSHHQKRVRSIADRSGLLAGGRIREVAPTEQFFEEPQTEAARRYVRTGHCDVPSLNALPEELADAGASVGDEVAAEASPQTVDARRESYQRRKVKRRERSPGRVDSTSPRPLQKAETFRPASQGPRNFHWLIKGKLGGTPRPGAVVPIERDLAALKRPQITTLVTLKLDRLRGDVVATCDIDLLHFPIVDMKTPELDAATDFLADMTRRILEGERVALHCEAGIGRTGTMLACYLIYHGHGAEEALARVRSVYHRYVQSRSQESFLHDFEAFVAGR